MFAVYFMFFTQEVLVGDFCVTDTESCDENLILAFEDNGRIFIEDIFFYCRKILLNIDRDNGQTPSARQDPRSFLT